MVGEGTVGVDAVDVGKFGVACPRGQCPFVFVGGVVEDEVNHQTDALRAEGVGQVAELIHRAERGVDFPVTAHRVAAVVFPVGGAEEGHQMQVGDAKFFEVGDFGFDPRQIISEQVHITHRAHHFIGLEPVGVLFPGRVQCLEFGGPREPGFGEGVQQGFEVEEEIVLSVIKLIVQGK